VKVYARYSSPVITQFRPFASLRERVHCVKRGITRERATWRVTSVRILRRPHSAAFDCFVCHSTLMCRNRVSRHSRTRRSRRGIRRYVGRDAYEETLMRFRSIRKSFGKLATTAVTTSLYPPPPPSRFPTFLPLLLLALCVDFLRSAFLIYQILSITVKYYVERYV